jgi:hypothetical protein
MLHNVVELNHVPTSSASGTCLFCSVVERWTLKLEVPGSNPDGGSSVCYTYDERV